MNPNKINKNKVSFRAFVALLLVEFILCLTPFTGVNAQNVPSVLLQPRGLIAVKSDTDSKRSDQKTDSQNKKNIQSGVVPLATPLTQLSPLGLEMAHLLGVDDEMERIYILRREVTQKKISESRQEILEHKLDHLIAYVGRVVLKTSLEVDFVMSELAYDIGRDQFLISKLNNKQDKRLLLANRLDAITNGVLWSLSSAFAIPGYKHPRVSVPAGILGVVAGAVPSTLELAALQIPVRGKIKREGEGNPLCFVLNVSGNQDYHLPDLVKRYLKSIPPGKTDIRSRREQLLASWQTAGLLPVRKSRSYRKTVRLVTGTFDSKKENLNSSVLGDRMLMLNHFRVTVFTMKRGLYELTSAL